MKTLLLICSFLISTLCFGQKGFLTGSVTGDFPKSLGDGFGGEITGNGKIAEKTFLGFGVGVTQFANLNKPYIPFTAKVTFAPGEDFKKLIPLITAQAGYGLYSGKGTTAYTKNSNGGFTYFVGVGFAGATKGKARVQASIGYSSFSFKMPSATTDDFGNIIISNKQQGFGGVSLKFGIMLM